MAKQKKTQPKKKPTTGQPKSKPAVEQTKSKPAASKPEKKAPVSQPKNKPTIVLVGMMGSGKTHVGQSLASKLGREFVDLDALIEKRGGIRIHHIFAIEGEAGFRVRESKLLAEVCESPNKILATGGGVVITPQNREILKNKKVLVIYLKVTPAASFVRTLDSNRPLLKTKDPLETITKLMEKRAPWYEEVADVQFDGESETVDEEILAWLAANKK